MTAQVRGEVVSVTPAGAYLRLALRVRGIAGHVRPGHFVALAVGGEQSAMLLRRAFSVYRAEVTGAGDGVVEIVLAVHGKGTAWLAERRVGDTVNVVGPLGRPFSLPRDRVPAVLVGGGYGSAPLFGLAERLVARGCRVDLVLGAASAGSLFGVAEAQRLAERAGGTVTVATEDGSLGQAGRVTDVLMDVLDAAAAGAGAGPGAGAEAGAGACAVYACGPMGMLRAVSELAALHGSVAQCAVEEAMACGVGVCMTCVLPVVGDDGVTRMVRSCVEGPVFAGDRVRWDCLDGPVGTVPADALGAPQQVGAH
jgi:dihydroorotate dehydrogenase electron transfer subunit